jgi:hypothetical protein
LRWSLEEVLERWTQLFSGPLLVTRYLSDARGQMTIPLPTSQRGQSRNGLDTLSRIC